MVTVPGTAMSETRHSDFGQGVRSVGFRPHALLLGRLRNLTSFYAVEWTRLPGRDRAL